jgi:hypothetical protein
LRFVGVIVVAAEQQNFEVGRLAQAGDLVAAAFNGCLERRGLVFFALAVVAWFPEGLCAEAVVAAGGGVVGFDARELGAAC